MRKRKGISQVQSHLAEEEWYRVTQNCVFQMLNSFRSEPNMFKASQKIQIFYYLYKALVYPNRYVSQEHYNDCIRLMENDYKIPKEVLPDLVYTLLFITQQLSQFHMACSLTDPPDTPPVEPTLFTAREETDDVSSTFVHVHRPNLFLKKIPTCLLFQKAPLNSLMVLEATTQDSCEPSKQCNIKTKSSPSNFLSEKILPGCLTASPNYQFTKEIIDNTLKILKKLVEKECLEENKKEIDTFQVTPPHPSDTEIVLETERINEKNTVNKVLEKKEIEKSYKMYKRKSFSRKTLQKDENTRKENEKPHKTIRVSNASYHCVSVSEDDSNSCFRNFAEILCELKKFELYIEEKEENGLTRKVAILRSDSPDSFLANSFDETKVKTFQDNSKFYHWSKKEEEVFISIYNRWCVSPLGPGNSWSEIIHDMYQSGYSRTRQQCRDKLKQLIQSKQAVKTSLGKIICVGKNLETSS